MMFQTSLLWQLTRRDVTGRYRGSMFGLLWSMLTPLLMLALYGFVFGVVFQAKWQNIAEGGLARGVRGEYAVILFSGLILHALLAECLARAPVIIVQNTNFVKKIVFPLQVLPVMVVTSALFHFAVGFGVFAAGLLAVYHTLPWTLFFMPLILVPFALFCFGLCWFLASLGVYIRDISQMTGIATSLLLFLSPIFYPVSALPERVRAWIYLNPLSVPVEQFRRIAIEGASPEWTPLIIYTSVSIVFALAGFWWFQKTRKGFADVL